MVRIKPGFDGKGQASGFYDGPPPPPNTYRGKVKKMGLAKIGSGDNVGKDRIALVLEITEGQYKGAGILHSINLTTESGWAVNQFLHAMTDGSEKQKTVLEKWFYDVGYDVEPEATGKMGQQFISIGGKFKPIGKPVAFITKMDSYNGEPKAAIDRFVVPQAVSEEPEVEPEVLDEPVVEEPSSGLDEFAVETTSNPEPEAVSVGANATDLDSDDPWS